MVAKEEIMGKIIFDAFPDNPDDPQATGVLNLRRSLESVLKTKKSDTMAIQKYDIRRPKEEGGGFEARYWSPINTPVLAPDYSVKYIIHRVEDVTEYINLRKSGKEQLKITEELRTRAGEMEVEIYERAQEIQEINRQLKMANSNLALQNEIKTKFFANVSHELRTPLMLILGPVRSLLGDGNLKPEQLNTLRLIEENASILLKHVTDLLDIAILEAGKMPIQYFTFDMVNLIKKTIALFNNALEKKNLECLTFLPQNLEIQADKEKIQRLFINLLSNAVKFTPEHGTIRVELKQNKKLTLIIEDNGPGIPPELRDAIFERFYQVEKSSTRTFGGTGLGLSIVKDFIDLHKGTIKVKASSLGGVSFVVSLPLKAPKNTVVKTQEYIPAFNEGEGNIAIAGIEEFIPHPKSKEIDDNKPQVLIVEDNKALNTYLSEILEDSYKVERAYNGQEGLNKAIELNPALIVSDIMMPKMDGTEMVQQIRQNRSLLSTPILILTAKVDDELCVQMLKKGAQDYMIKPFSPEEFKARVANLILMKKAEDELERFVYLASHDLKSPLPAIDHLVSWIEEDNDSSLSEQSRKHLNALRKRASRMSNLLDGLLKYSQTVNINTEPKSIDLTKMVKSIVSTQTHAKNFEFIYELPSKKIIAEREPLYEIFSLLISNSIQHHHIGGGLIKVGMREETKQYKFFVADDGPGIDPKYHKKIFELYQRLQSRDILESSGVGLSIVKKILDFKGGKISVDSELGKGATFWFTWPKRGGNDYGTE